MLDRRGEPGSHTQIGQIIRLVRRPHPGPLFFVMDVFMAFIPSVNVNYIHKMLGDTNTIMDAHAPKILASFEQQFKNTGVIVSS